MNPKQNSPDLDDLVGEEEPERESEWKTCLNCDGTGEDEIGRCPICGGKGEVLS